MTDEAFFNRAATLGGLFLAIVLALFIFSQCAADAEVSREMARRCAEAGRDWQTGPLWPSHCYPTPSPIAK